MTRLDTYAPQQTQRRQIPRQRAGHGVVVGTDGSMWGTAALEWATRHAWLRGTELTVYQAATKTNDWDIAEHFPALQPLPVDIHSGSIDPLQSLVPASSYSELAVLGCRGHQHSTIGLGRWVLPVVSAAHCDIVVVRGLPEAVHGRHRRITAVISGGPGDYQVLGRAAAVATLYRAELAVVHACMDVTGKHDHVLDAAKEYLEISDPRIKPNVELVHTRAHEMIAGRDDSDLLVIGSGNPSAPGLGTVTKAALHHALCPVLVTHV